MNSAPGLWRRFVAWLERRSESFFDEHPTLVLLWVVGFLVVLVLAFLSVVLPGFAATILALFTVPYGVPGHGPYVALAIVVAYVALVTISGLAALAWPVLSWVVIVGAWGWLLYQSPSTALLIAAVFVVVNFVYRAVMQHLANQRRIIAALEKQASNRDTQGARDVDKSED